MPAHAQCTQHTSRCEPLILAGGDPASNSIGERACWVNTVGPRQPPPNSIHLSLLERVRLRRLRVNQYDSMIHSPGNFSLSKPSPTSLRVGCMRSLELSADAVLHVRHSQAGSVLPSGATGWRLLMFATHLFQW